MRKFYYLVPVILAALMMLSPVSAIAMSGQLPQNVYLPAGAEIDLDGTPYFIVVFSDNLNYTKIKIEVSYEPQECANYIEVTPAETEITLPPKVSQETPNKKIPIAIKIDPNAPTAKCKIKVSATEVRETGDSVSVVPSVAIVGRLNIVGATSKLTVDLADLAGQPVEGIIEIYQITDAKTGNKVLIYRSSKKERFATVPVVPTGDGVAGYYVVAYVEGVKLGEKTITNVAEDDTVVVDIKGSVIRMIISEPIIESDFLKSFYTITVPKGFSFDNAEIVAVILKDGKEVKSVNLGSVTLIGREDNKPAISNAPIVIPMSSLHLEKGTYTLRVELVYDGKVWAASEKSFTVTKDYSGFLGNLSRNQMIGIGVVVFGLILVGGILLGGGKKSKKKAKNRR